MPSRRPAHPGGRDAQMKMGPRSTPGVFRVGRGEPRDGSGRARPSACETFPRCVDRRGRTRSLDWPGAHLPGSRRQVIPGCCRRLLHSSRESSCAESAERLLFFGSTLRGIHKSPRLSFPVARVNAPAQHDGDHSCRAVSRGRVGPYSRRPCGCLRSRPRPRRSSSGHAAAWSCRNGFRGAWSLRETHPNRTRPVR